MNYFGIKWYKSYDSMLKKPDGELRSEWFGKNDYSDQSSESKMKYFWLFQSHSPIVFSYLGQALSEAVVMPSNFIR